MGPVPHLYPLVKLADQSPLYAVCVADSHQARLVVCGLGAVLTEEDFEGPEPIDRTRVAGWAEVRYQSRIEDHIQKNAREIVERLGRIVERGEVDYVILGGDDPVLGEPGSTLTPAIREKLIDEEHISIDAGAARDPETHAPGGARHRGAREPAARGHRDRSLQGRGLAVAGLGPTIEALNLEQVDQLLLSERFNGNHAGWQCAHRRVLGLEPTPMACPFCEAPMPQWVELREAMVRRAERTGRKVEIVESHPGLEALDGVGRSYATGWSYAGLSRTGLGRRGVFNVRLAADLGHRSQHRNNVPAVRSGWASHFRSSSAWMAPAISSSVPPRAAAASGRTASRRRGS